MASTKNQQIFKFIIERLSGTLGRTHLLKLVYLADYHFHKLTGKSISTFKYLWHNNGPFDSSLYDDINNLKESTYIEEEEVHFPTCRGYVFHNTSHQMIYNELSTQDIYMLEYAIRTYGKINLQTLLEDVVYKTEPMMELTSKKALGEYLPMEIVDNKDKEELYEGLDPEDIIEGAEAIKEGKAHTLEEVFSALQN
jgi:uncharacterized phage-associated protein